MGILKFSNFINKNLNIGTKEFTLHNNKLKFIANHILVDISFLIYNIYELIESELNDIIKMLICKKGNKKIIEKHVLEIISRDYYKDIIKPEHVENIDTFNEKLKNIDLIDIIKTKLVDVLLFYIENIHYKEYIKNIIIVFDGIPSLSKIIKQKQRKIKKILEHKKKKENFSKVEGILNGNTLRLYDVLTNKQFISEKYNININIGEYEKYKYYINKHIYPNSNIIIALEKYIKSSITNYNLVVLNSSLCGEADNKIFKYIYSNNLDGELYIHTTDSDLLYQSVIQSCYYKIMSRNVNINLCKYIKTFNMDTIQCIKCSNILDSISSIYNKLKPSNLSFRYEVIVDLFLIFYFFGNDNLPCSLEISPEIKIEKFIIFHIESLNSSNIIKYTPEIKFDIYNFLKYVKILQNNISKLLTEVKLTKYFKLNNILYNILIENYNMEEILDLYKNYISYKRNELSDEQLEELYDDDLRKKCNYKYDEKYLNFFNKYDKLIEENINYYDNKYNGMYLLNKNIINVNDYYTNLINYINITAVQDVQSEYPFLYENCNIEHYEIYEKMKYDRDIIDNYLNLFYYMINSLFDSMKRFKSNNIIYFKYLYCPKIEHIIKYLEENDLEEIVNNWEAKILEQNNITLSANIHDIIINSDVENIQDFKKIDINSIIGN